MKLIVTHKKPDADALVSTWLAQRYLFPGEETEVRFVGRTFRPYDGAADCILDVGNTYDPDRLLFDHKPPAFRDRHQTCAARLLWEHLLSLGKPVHHLATLIEAVHDGDSSKRRQGSLAYHQSRHSGFHAYFRSIAPTCPDDYALYTSVRDWLDRYVDMLRTAPSQLAAEDVSTGGDAFKLSFADGTTCSV